MRHAKKETYARLLTAIGSTLLIYLWIQVTGTTMNAATKMLPLWINHSISFLEFFKSDMKGPILLLLGVSIYSIILGRVSWYYQSKWNISLRHAERRENNDFRARLDVARIRSKSFDDLNKRIQELPYAWQTRMWFADQMMQLFSTLVSFIIFGASLLWYEPLYAFIILFTSFPMMYLEFKMTAKWWALFERMIPHNKKRSILEKAYNPTTPFIQGLMFNQHSTLKKLVEENSTEVINAYEEIRKKNVILEIPVNILSTLGLIFVMILTMKSVFNGGSIGALAVILAAAKTYHGTLESVVSMVAQQWNSAKGVILIEQDFARLEPVVQTPNPIKPDFEGTPCLVMEDVWFYYPDTEGDVLKGVSLKFEPGTKTAIVGKSGHGKSTIQALLTRTYDPTQGAIYANGINLRNIEPRDWNEYITALTQDYKIIERRINEEIASSRLDKPLDPEKVTKAIFAAHLNEVIDKAPEGVETQIGTEMGGMEFSGGQNHRVALARALYRETPILILDEPDAKLDAESAQRVMDNIFALEGFTVIIITHHVSHAQRCDNIVVMNDGEVAEMGSHPELITKNGVYASLFRKDEARARLAVS